MVKQLGPPTAWDWVCFEAVGKLFSKALAAERVRLQTEVLPRMKASGCELKNPNSWGRAVLLCNSHGGSGVCKREFQGYRKPYCETDQMAADQSLGEKMAPLLGKRCTFGGRLISCTRSWKRDLCQQMLDGTLSQHEAKSTLQCVYNEKAGFKKARKQAGDILNALNQIPGQMILSNNCTRTWDDLALQCENPKALYELPERMPGVSLPTCLPDPNRDGSDVICYAGLYAIDLPDRKITLPSREKKIVIPGIGHASDRATGFGRSKVQRDGLPSRPAKLASGGASGFAKGTASRIKPKPGLPNQLVKNGPDLVARDSVGGAHQRSAWGRTITVAQAPSGCRVDILYGVKNQGTEKSPGFSIEWTSRGGRRPLFSHQFAGLNAGSHHSLKSSLQLKSGMNILSLNIDPRNMVQESKENNNRYGLNIRINGNCDSQPSTGTKGRRPSSKPDNNLAPRRFQLTK